MLVICFFKHQIEELITQNAYNHLIMDYLWQTSQFHGHTCKTANSPLIIRSQEQTAQREDQNFCIQSQDAILSLA